MNKRKLISIGAAFVTGLASSALMASERIPAGEIETLYSFGTEVPPAILQLRRRVGCL